MPSGYLSADASGPKAVYAAHSGDPIIGSGDGSNFDFQSAYFTSGWKDGATLTVTGYDNGAQVAVQSFNFGTSDSTYVEFTSEFDSVDQLVFHSEGGIENGYGAGNIFIVDDLSFSVPVPRTMVSGGDRHKRTQPGWPDLQFAGPGRQMAFLELKRARSGRLSAAQEAMREHLERCGFPHLITDDVDEAIAWLKAHGILRDRFSVQ